MHCQNKVAFIYFWTDSKSVQKGEGFLWTDLELRVHSWIAWRCHNFTWIELQNPTFPFLFSRWSLTAQISKGTKHYWFTLVEFPHCILTLRYICSKLLDTRWGVRHCVISPLTGGAITGRHYRKTLQENRNLKAVTQHCVLWLLCPVVDPELIGTSGRADCSRELI